MSIIIPYHLSSSNIFYTVKVKYIGWTESNRVQEAVGWRGERSRCREVVVQIVTVAPEGVEDIAPDRSQIPPSAGNYFTSLEPRNGTPLPNPLDSKQA